MTHINFPFNPVLGLSSPFLQTVLGSFGFPLQDPPSKPMIVQVSDNDQLYCLESTPSGWEPNEPTTILLHGLGGSSRSRYMVRLSRYLYAHGQKVIRVNLRGSGPGFGLARKPSNAGQSEDLLTVCHRILDRYPASKLRLVGFSLSGNIVLKLLGELGNLAVPMIEKAIAVCPAVNLKEGVTSIGLPENWFFEKYYIDCLLEMVARKSKYYRDYPIVNFPKPLKMYKFDDLYTAPLSGYQDAEEYYSRSSSYKIVKEIAVPTKILYSKDDPIIPAKAIEEMELSPYVEVFCTHHGGHLGFLSWSGSQFWFRWMDRQVISWLGQ